MSSSPAPFSDIGKKAKGKFYFVDLTEFLRMIVNDNEVL